MTNSPAPPPSPTTGTSPPAARDAETARSALLVSETEAAPDLEERLAAAGLSVTRAAPREALRAARDAAPGVVLLAFGTREGEGALKTLARRLRADASTLALPVVFLFREDGRALRSAAQHLGADDYFAQDAPADEIRARLASLFWRVGAARRAAPAHAEQRDEIDNFIFLLDAVAADLAEGLTGTVALVEAAGGREPAASLREAHAFLKLNLRRADAVAFYGPTTLVAYLPRAGSDAARATLARLRAEFLAARPESDLLAGLASFPADGAEVETLVERAEAALDESRGETGADAAARVRAYGAGLVRQHNREADAHVHGTAETEQETRRGGAGGAGGVSGVSGVSGAVGAGGAIRADAGSAETRATGPVPGAGGGVPLHEDSARDAPPREASSRATSARETATREAAESPAPEEFRPRRSTLRKLMLVISDAARMAQVNLLMRSASYEVRAAFDGNHALNLLRIDTPDVLLLDYDLHGMNGAEMLRRLRQQAGGGRLPPAVVLVPAGRDEARREASEAGARAVVELPYDPVMLLEILGAADRLEE